MNLWKIISNLYPLVLAYKSWSAYNIFNYLYSIMENTPCSTEHGVFIACLIAVFLRMLGAIRMPVSPHKY